MAIKRQITVCLDNKPGALAKLCNALGRKKINILAISVADHIDAGVIRIVTDSTGQAVAVIKKMGYPVVTRDVIVVELCNEPGALAEVAGKLAQAGINIEFVYGSAHKGCDMPTIIFAVSDVKKANHILC